MKKGGFLTLAMYALPMEVYFASLNFVFGAPLGDKDWIAGGLAGLFTVLGVLLIVMPGDAKLLRRDTSARSGHVRARRHMTSFTPSPCRVGPRRML